MEKRKEAAMTVEHEDSSTAIFEWTGKSCKIA